MCGFAAGFKKGGAAGAFGHTFGVKVQRVQKVQRERFLRWTGPMGRRVRKFDGAFGPEGCGLPFGQ